jgi:hypothetical protein
MNRHEAHGGIIAVGVSTMIMTAEAVSNSARILRDEARPDTTDKADLRWITERLDEVQGLLQDISAQLSTLPLGAKSARSRGSEPN